LYEITYEEFHDLFSSPNILLLIKLRIMRWAGHMARMGRGEVLEWFWWGNLREKE
jgi:hypothetical protein